MTTYTMDQSHSSIGFTARHAMITKVRGQFTDYEATVNVDDSNQATINATIQTASINTGNADRDNHVKGEDFFDVAQFPTMTFVAQMPAPSSTTGNTKIAGELTIKGVTKPVELDVEFLGESEDPFGNVRQGFEATTSINRTDFGIDFNAPLKTGGVLISEKIGIEISGSAIKQS
ncbi:YceI family protein [Corynebacterium aquilae]|uniref:Polyisoprenoid-binding protein n=1 Tax=Corynebacterium aquilae DSM 44791 TaxID=1431546 RepID=A0A1L7CFX2_9CORY|nr:YceI family protein [Corynebacterium aquilae]APT84770.1 polyisoprenoid-binding protein [Corynebacterium aquilae DSM 44791]